jgi:tripeptidyl-peptidase-1
MLLYLRLAVLVSCLIFGAIAGPLSYEHTEARTRRQVPSSHSLHERHLPHWSEQWTKRSKVLDTQILPMRIGLKQGNLGEGHNKLMDMYALKSVIQGKIWG